MNNGGHGLFEFTLPKNNKGTVEVPAIASNTFDIPKAFKVIAEHRGTSKGKAMISETTLALGSY